MSYREIANKISELRWVDATHTRSGDVLKVRRLERLVVCCAIGLLVAGAALDAVEDVNQQQGGLALVGDLLFVLLGLVVLFFLYRLSPLALKRYNDELSRAVAAEHRDSEAWRNKASKLLRGLGQVIEDQFSDWQLSPAEKEVALLLLKGASLKEIATLRDTSERTVRQQASQVYAKAGVGGRAELSAFFLEDLLLPTSEKVPRS